ncbi:propanediol utilization protein [Litorisediminicola beolgyonensis]|uniref:Propanediol utilization protein n=1 Tax=Litorisediminicola beolgyonensis TaxID=1173614 RepID=A0ABW3ZH38_9RHOB
MRPESDSADRDPGFRVAGHFGEFLQGRLGPEGPVALVTVPCAGVGVTARRVGEAGALRQSVPVVDGEVAARFLSALGLPVGGYALEAEAPAGLGFGMSTAGLVALARAGGATGDIAAACRLAEGASDPLMLKCPAAALWAPREGRVLEEMPEPPACEIVGGARPGQLWTDPADMAFPDIAHLVDQWRQACSAADLESAARLATRSATRTTALRGPADDPTPELAARLGALGWLRAHTGTLRGLIFAPGTVPSGVETALAEAGLSRILRFQAGRAS